MVGPPGRQTSQSGGALPGGAASRSLRLYRTHMFRPDLPCTRNCGESSEGLRLAECGGNGYRGEWVGRTPLTQFWMGSAVTRILHGSQKSFLWRLAQLGGMVDIRYALRPRFWPNPRARKMVTSRPLCLEV